MREQEPEDDDEDEDDAAESLLDDEAGAEAEADDEDEDDQNVDDASDADMMLAEISHSPPSSSSTDPAIPIPLLHRLLHHSFHNPDTMKLSTDARAAMGKYIEVFIREGIARCAFEVSEKIGAGDSGLELGRDDGWLEVEDLERVGGTACVGFLRERRSGVAVVDTQRDNCEREYEYDTQGYACQWSLIQRHAFYAQSCSV